MNKQEQLTLPEFVEREGIVVKSAEPIMSTFDMAMAWKVVLTRKGGKTMTIPHWGHGGGLGSPAEEVPHVVDSLICDSSIYESYGDSVKDYESDFGPINAEDKWANERAIRRLLAACKSSHDRFLAFLGPELYEEVTTQVEPY